MKFHQVTLGQKHSTAIDWDEIKRKVASLQEIIEQKEILSPEEKHSLLKDKDQQVLLFLLRLLDKQIHFIGNAII